MSRNHCVGRAMNNRDMQKVLLHLRKDPVVKAVYDAKSEEIGPNIFRFKAEIGGSQSLSLSQQESVLHLVSMKSACLLLAYHSFIAVLPERQPQDVRHLCAGAKTSKACDSDATVLCTATLAWRSG